MQSDRPKKRAENENIHEKVHNRCLVMNRNGERVGFYDKIHLFDAFGVKESDTFLSGSQLGLFQLDIGKVGVWFVMIRDFRKSHVL